MTRIGITGQAGFIGSHLANYLRIQDDIELISFIRDYFENTIALEKFVAKCDVIIHLAAMSRNPDGKLLYENNITLDKKLIAALEKKNSHAHVIFASTTHEMREGDYYASNVTVKNFSGNGAESLRQWSCRTLLDHTANRILTR